MDTEWRQGFFVRVLMVELVNERLKVVWRENGESDSPMMKVSHGDEIVKQRGFDD